MSTNRRKRRLQLLADTEQSIAQVKVAVVEGKEQSHPKAMWLLAELRRVERRLQSLLKEMENPQN